MQTLHSFLPCYCHDSCSVKGIHEEGLSSPRFYFLCRPEKLIFSSHQSWQEQWMLIFTYEYFHLHMNISIAGRDCTSSIPVGSKISLHEWWQKDDQDREITPNWNLRKNIRKCLWVNYSFSYSCTAFSVMLLLFMKLCREFQFVLYWLLCSLTNNL